MIKTVSQNELSVNIKTLIKEKQTKIDAPEWRVYFLLCVYEILYV